MSNFENIIFGHSADIFTSYTPDNSQTYYLPSTIQENESNYQLPNYFGYFDQDYVPENSYQYFENGHQPSEEGNQVCSYPVLNQVYVPESQIYKVVHAVEYNGTTYFYESLVDFTVYSPTTTYTPPHVVDENTLDVYWPGENTPTDNEEQYIENTSEYDYQPSFVENLITEHDVCLSPSINMSSFYPPELDLDASISNSYLNASHVQSQCDQIENYHAVTNSAGREENVMYGNESTVYYEQVNYGWSYLRNDLSLGRYSGQDPMQAPVLSLEALDKNAIQAQVKYRKDSMYLTAISGKLYQKQTIPVVEKMPVITEVEDEYRMVDCSNKAIVNNKSVVQVKKCIKYSKKLCRSKSIRVSESVTEMENSTDDDHMISRSIGKLSKNKQQIDLAVGENIFTNRCKKMYRKESSLFVKNVHLIKEVSDTCKVTESSKGILPQMEKSYSVIEENIFVKRIEELIRKERKKDFHEMSVIQEADDDENHVVQSSNVNIPKIGQSVVQTNAFTGRSKNLYRKERRQGFEKMPVIEEIDDKEHMEQLSTEKLLKIKNSVVRTNIFNERAKKWYEKEMFQDLEKMLAIKEAENEDYVGESHNRKVSKRKQTDLNVQKDAFSVTSVKQHAKHNFTNIGKMSPIQETDKHLQIDETNEIGNNGHLKSFQTEELNTDIDKDSDGFLDKNENIEKNLFSQENGFLSKTNEKTQAENTNAGNLLYPMDVGKSSVINYDRSSLDECEDTTDLIALAGNNSAESTSLSSLWEEVDLNETLETATALESKNESTKVHSQEPKKKRFENFRKFLERLLCCCTKGPT